MFWKPMKADHGVLIQWSNILYYHRLACPTKWIWKRYDGRPRWRYGRFNKTTPTHHHINKWHHINAGNMSCNILSRFFFLFCVTTFIFLAQVDPTHFEHFVMFLNDTMVQNIILPQIALAQDHTKTKNGRPRCFGQSCRGTSVFWSHDPKYHNTSNWFGSGSSKTRQRETTMFWKIM